MRTEESWMLSATAFAAVAGCAGLLTWLCVGWFGNQPLLTAMIAVVLVELFLACVGIIAILLTERMTVTMLELERRPATPSTHRPQPSPVWLRIADTDRPWAGKSHVSPREQGPATIRFAAREETHDPADRWQQRPAA